MLRSAIGAALLVTLTAVVPTPPVNAIAGVVARSSLPDCLSFDALDVDLSPWPVLPRVAARRGVAVTLRADAMTVGRLRIRDLEVSTSRLDAPLSALWERSRASIRDAHVRARITATDLSRLLGPLGLGVDIRLGHGQLLITMPGMMSSISLDLAARDGALIATPTSPGGFRFPALRLEAPLGIVIQDALVTEDGLTVRGSASRELRVDDELCESLPAILVEGG